MQHTKAAYVGRLLSALTGLISLVACNQAAPPGSPPPPTVTVTRPEQKLVENWSEFTGRTAAVNFVNVTPRVSGYIVDIPFKLIFFFDFSAKADQYLICRLFVFHL